MADRLVSFGGGAVSSGLQVLTSEAFLRSFRSIPIHSTLFRGWFTAVSPFTGSGEPRYKSNLFQLGKTLVQVSFFNICIFKALLQWVFKGAGSRCWMSSLVPSFRALFRCLCRVVTLLGSSQVSAAPLQPEFLSDSTGGFILFQPSALSAHFAPADQCKFSSSEDCKFCKTRSKGTDG